MTDDNGMVNTSKAWGKASRVIGNIVASTLTGVEREVARRGYRAANELRNASLVVLRGTRSGRRYRVSGTKKYYTASAPGEPPAVRTGTFRNSWGVRVHAERSGKVYRVVSSIESKLKVGEYLLGEILENGTKRMAPRPYKDKIKQEAFPRVRAIYQRPYSGK